MNNQPVLGPIPDGCREKTVMLCQRVRFDWLVAWIDSSPVYRENKVVHYQPQHASTHTHMRTHTHTQFRKPFVQEIVPQTNHINLRDVNVLSLMLINNPLGFGK